MRKVFVSIISNNGFDFTNFKGRDFDLGGKSFSEPVSYLVDNKIEANDSIVFVTGLLGDEASSRYNKFKNEAVGICAEHGVGVDNVNFISIDISDSRDVQDSLTYSEFFKSVSDVIKDGDFLYADITCPNNALSIALLISLNYANKACRDVLVDTIIYEQTYVVGEVDIIDVSSLVHLLSIVSEAKAGQKKSMDEFLNFLIG